MPSCLPARKNIACDLNNLKWMDRIDARHGVIFFAAGVSIISRQNKSNYPKSAAGIQGEEWYLMPVVLLSQMMLKTWIKQAGIKDVGAYLSVRDAQDCLVKSPL